LIQKGPDKVNLTRRQFAKGSAAVLIGSSALATGLPAVPAGAPVSGELTVDLSTAGTPFNRMLFGQFLEHFQRQVYGGVFDPGSHLADKDGFRTDVIEALRELKVPIVRWPGGCFASAYHWRDGIGKDRQPSFDKAWGVEDPNTFGTDEFVKWCHLVGAEPYICTNAGTGTSEEMSDWVEYCNLKDEGRYSRMRAANGCPEPFNVRYWSIGNENYLGGEIGAKTVEEWGPLVRESAKMMRAVDSDLQILAAATVTGNWTPPMLKEAGKYLNYISIHGYWDPLWQRGTHPSDYLHCMAFCEAPEQQIRQAVELLNQTGFGDRIRIAFDEWNLRGWHHPGFPGGGANQLAMISERGESDRNETYTMADAVFSASFLNGCLRQAKYVQMACVAPVVNVRGPLFVHPNGIVKRTTFHVLRMYSDLLQPNVVQTRVVCDGLHVDQKTVPALDAVATCSDDRKQAAIALINRHPDAPARWKMNIRNTISGERTRITVLSGDSPDAYNDVARPNRVVPQSIESSPSAGYLELPPHSVAVVQINI
jgi:alpha-L-arabinofuranosidase